MMAAAIEAPLATLQCQHTRINQLQTNHANKLCATIEIVTPARCPESLWLAIQQIATQRMVHLLVAPATR